MISIFSKILFHFGKYVLFMKGLFLKPEKFSFYRRQIFVEMESIGVSSMAIVSITSIFLGAVISIQAAHNLFNKFVPLFVVGVVTRDSIVLEFAPTIMCLVLAGKVGSSISSELGTMRVTEQIDALEIMGINSSGFLVLPKIVAAMVMFPCLILISTFLGITGGWVSGVMSGVISSDNYIRGLHFNFQPFNVTFSMMKTLVFAFIFTSVSAYHGYYTEGGALEVGKSSTNAVVYSTILILLFDFILTQIFLS